MSKRAVLYARVSGDDRGKEGRNLESQIEMCRGYALGKKYQVVKAVKEPEEGASGVLWDLPGLNEVRALAKAHAFDVLIAREVDRLSRSAGKLDDLYEELGESGVEIEYVLLQTDNTPVGTFIRRMQVNIAELERSQITARSVRGRRNKAASGQVVLPGRVAYGYRRGVVMANGTLRMLEPKQRPGPGERGTLVPYEPEAEIVRQVYFWYIEGNESGEPLSLRAICRRLEGIPTYADLNNTPKGRRRGGWCNTMIANMLKNEVYAGVWHFGRRNPGAKKGKKDNPSEYHIAVEVPALVDRSLWEAAQQRFDWNREHSPRNRKRSYLLANMIECGTCGKRAAALTVTNSDGRSTPYYRCSTRWGNMVHNCGTPSFRADQVDEAVWDWVSSLLHDPVFLEKALKDYQAEQGQVIEPLRARLRRIDGQIAACNTELAKLLDLYRTTDFPKALLEKETNRIRGDLERHEQDRARVAGQLEAATLTPEQVEGLQQFVAGVRADLERANTDFQGRRGLLQRIRLQVVLSVKDGQRVVTPSFLMRSTDIVIATSIN